MTPYNSSNRIPVQEQYKNVSYPVWIYPVVSPQANDKTMPRRFQTSGDNAHILPDLRHHPKFPTMYCFFHPANSYILESFFDSLAYMPDRPFHYLSKPSIKAECQRCLYQNDNQVDPNGPALQKTPFHIYRREQVQTPMQKHRLLAFLPNNDW